MSIDLERSNINNELEQIVENIENSIDQISLEQAMKELSTLANNLLFHYRTNDCEARLFGSKRLDQCALRIGALSLELLPSNRRKKSFDNSLFFYLATSIYAVGGHTRVMLDFVKAQPRRHHVLVLTDVLGERELGQEATEWFKLLGVEVIWLEGRLWLARLLSLQALLMKRRPATVFLFNHHQDVISVASCQPELAKNFIYYHHCDHEFALGVYTPHFSHIDLSPRIFHTCRQQLGINNHYLPLAIQDKGNLSSKAGFFQSGSLRTASAGTYNKYISSDTEDYFYMVALRLSELPGTHLHIGSLGDGQINRLRELFIKKHLDWNRIVFLPWVKSLWDTLCDFNVDIYIPSFPQGGGRTAIEVMGAGIPIAVRDTGNLDELNGIEMFYPEVYRWRDTNELLTILQNLDSVNLFYSGQNARCWYEKNYRFEYLTQSLAGLPDTLPDIDVPGSPSRCHKVFLLDIDKIASENLFFMEQPHDSAYLTWRDRHRWSASALARLAEQVVPLLESGAGVHLLMIAAADEKNALADSIDTLAAQGSAGWGLTVFSPDPCPNPLFETEPTLAWVQITAAEELPSALNQAVALSPVDWFMVCSPGIRFEPPFVSLVLATSAQNPDWRCVYFDEERINSDGQMTDPRLKPDANIELLCSSAYVGQAVLAHRALWPTLNLYLAAMPRAFAFDAALRAVELGGEAALGHVDELTVALPETADGTAEDWALIAKPLLEGYLQRSGLIANVNDGYLPATFFVDYALTANPLVSIIIPTKNRLDLLQPCVESLLEKTSYSNYEVIIVDNSSTDPATLAYLEQLLAHDERIKVLRYAKNYNYSAINNFAVRQAKGEFLVLLNNDTVVLQENWLERMVAIGLRQEIGAVGCRLVYVDQRVQHAGVIIGLSGIAEHIGIGSLINDSGYMGRTQLTQNFSAVTAACMLVRKDLFIEVGGLDEKDFSILYNDIDLCLKITERGYQIIWTPFVTLIHHGNSSLKQEHDASREKKNLLSRKAFIKKWSSRLGNDPAYNRHLSLRQREWMIDGDFDVPWHPDLESLPRVVAQPPDEMGVGQYRVIGPIKELTENQRICSFLLPPLNSDKQFLPYVSELIRAKPTTLLLQNAFSNFHLDDLQNYAELLPDVFRVFGQDDIVFSVPQKSSAHKHFGKDTKARVRRAISFCHRVIVTNEIMAEALRDMVADIHVVPNYLERSRWGDLKPLRAERRKPRVGWAGAQQHGGDLEFILPVVEATANEVDWIFMGMCPPKLRYHVAESHNAVPFDQYPATLATLDLDLAIAPLEINRFNAAKSNLRLLEYGAVGYPVICTDIQPYQNAPVTRVPNNPDAWIEAIREHIHDLDATHAAGDQLHTWVLSNWMLDQHLDEWLRALLPG